MSTTALADELAARLPGRVRRDVPFAELSTYRVGGPVAVLARVATAGEVEAVADVVARHRPPILVVGRGSNLLVGDGGFAGVALVLEDEFEAIELPGPDDEPVVRAGGAVPLPVLARRAADAGIAGLEFFVGIPGSVGGAVRMNAGGHGRETVDVLTAATVVDLLAGGGPVARRVDELDLRYRHSNVSASEVVVSAEFAGSRDAPAACEARVAEVVRWRREHQPGGANAGSVFRNPPGDSAGRLIDATGLKGLRVGGAVVSPKHANFFQAEDGATAADVAGLVAEVQRRVADATGVRLVPELLMVGDGFPEVVAP
ncbi:MAG TPA: UDP-N-acetylmuramate dehydrogenase [Acidimicrobiia bacterium]|nr:UDP-N-acetylmuramate dehydrogenase [Acidimicrobiia bacterium]